MKLFPFSFLISATFLVSSVTAYSLGPVEGSRISSFGGSVLVAGKAQVSHHQQSTLEMKKGKENVPQQMRGQYKRQQEMSQMRQQMEASQKYGADGLPVFNLFVRTSRANLWYPCGSFKGDDKAGGLCTNYRDGGFLSGISKKQIDAGVSGSLYRDKTKLVETICRSYPQLRKNRDELEFGFKLSYEGLSEEQQKITVVEPKEQKGLFDNISANIKSIFS